MAKIELSKTPHSMAIFFNAVRRRYQDLSSQEKTEFEVICIFDKTTISHQLKTKHNNACFKHSYKV